jgi:hypothetical protein
MGAIMQLRLSTVIISGLVVTGLGMAFYLATPESTNYVSANNEGQALAQSIAPIPLIEVDVDVDSLPVTAEVTVVRSYFQ